MRRDDVSPTQQTLLWSAAGVAPVPNGRPTRRRRRATAKRQLAPGGTLLQPNSSSNSFSHVDHPSQLAPAADGPELTIDGVAVLHWPSQAGRRDQLVATRTPRLLLVEDGHMPPMETDVLEDWMRVNAGLDELDARLAALARRARQRTGGPHLDADGLLRLGDRWVDIPEAQRPVLELLLSRLGGIVRYGDIAEACALSGLSTQSEAVKTTILRLGRRLADVGLELRNVRGRGYVVQVAADDHPT